MAIKQLLILCVCLCGCGVTDLLQPEAFITDDSGTLCSYNEWRTNGKPGLNGVITMDDDAIPDMLGLQLYLSSRYLATVDSVEFHINNISITPQKQGLWFGALVNIGETKGVVSIHTIGRIPQMGCPNTFDLVDIR